MQQVSFDSLQNISPCAEESYPVNSSSMLPLRTLPFISDGGQLPLCFMSAVSSFYSPVSDQVLWLFSIGSCIFMVKLFLLALIICLTISCPKRTLLTSGSCGSLSSPTAPMTYHFPSFQLQPSLLTLSFP